MNEGKIFEAQREYRIQNIIKEYLGSEDQLQKQVSAFIKEAEKGGYKIGSNAFINSIIGPRSKNLSKDEWRICRQKIMDTVEDLNERSELEEEVKEYHKKQADDAMRRGAEDLLVDDFQRRTGLNRDDYEDEEEK